MAVRSSVHLYLARPRPTKDQGEMGPGGAFLDWRLEPRIRPDAWLEPPVQEGAQDRRTAPPRRDTRFYGKTDDNTPTRLLA